MLQCWFRNLAWRFICIEVSWIVLAGWDDGFLGGMIMKVGGRFFVLPRDVDQEDINVKLDFGSANLMHW